MLPLPHLFLLQRLWLRPPLLLPLLLLGQRLLLLVLLRLLMLQLRLRLRLRTLPLLLLLLLLPPARGGAACCVGTRALCLGPGALAPLRLLGPAGTGSRRGGGGGSLQCGQWQRLQRPLVLGRRGLRCRLAATTDSRV